MRYKFIDALRGAAVISMILYHAVWDMVYILGMNRSWIYGTGAFIWQQSICMCFIFISGFCAGLGKRLFRRGITVFAAGLLISAVTCVFLPENGIIFGILTLLGSCMLITATAQKLPLKVPPAAGAAASAALFILLYKVPEGRVLFTDIPAELYRNYFTAYLGFPPASFASGDYFPLIPWIFLFLFGYFVCKLIKKLPAVPGFFSRGPKLLAAVGRHALAIYLLHQPVLYALAMAVSAIKGK